MGILYDGGQVSIPARFSYAFGVGLSKKWHLLPLTYRKFVVGATGQSPLHLRLDSENVKEISFHISKRREPAYWDSPTPECDKGRRMLAHVAIRPYKEI